MTEGKKGQTGPKRSKAQRQNDLVHIEEWLLKGFSERDIAGMLNEHRKGVYTLTRSAIHSDIVLLKEQWREDATKEMSIYIAEEFKGLAKQENELWKAWEDSKSEGKSTGDPAYMRLIIEIRTRRAKMLGLDSPSKALIQMTGENGGPIQHEHDIDLTGYTVEQLDLLAELVEGLEQDQRTQERTQFN